MKKIILIFIGVLTLSFTAKAQGNFANILLAESEDASKLLKGYFNPAMKGFIYGMNSGWYHTAKVHKVLGFDLTVGLNASIVPSKDEVFKLGDLNLSANGIIRNSPLYSPNTELSTFGGAGGSTIINIRKNITVGNTNTHVDSSFEMPEGIKDNLPLNAVPSPVVQLTVGLPFKMDGMLRYMPKINVKDGGAEFWGIGIKKEITSWFGPLDKLPLHVSLLAAYTSLNLDYNFDDDITTSNILTYTDASATFKLSAYTVQAIASLNFPIINIYGGFGYSSGSSTLSMDGNYEVQFHFSLPKANIAPQNVTFNAGGIKTTVGARLSLGFFKIFGSYTLQEYNTLNIGVAISIR